MTTREEQEGGADPKDLLYGARAIADFLGLTEKQARHRIESKDIPSFKISGTICARRSSLQAWMDDLEREAALRTSRGDKGE